MNDAWAPERDLSGEDASPGAPCRRQGLPELSEKEITAVKARYKSERNRRLTDKATEQYLRPVNGLASFSRVDPHSPVAARSPVTARYDVAVLGGGWAGILAGYHLRKAGIGDFCHLEQGGDFGGVWYWNRYPGIQCDNDSYCYLPLLEETGFLPSQKFADGAEILGYAKHLARDAGLYANALFHTVVESLGWNEDEDRWIIRTDRGDRIEARWVIMANGLINVPKLPGIAGIESFKGKMFHTSRWDYEYTGGTPDEPVLTGLADKAVAIVGTGASAVQAVPYLGRFARHLYVVQRTPSTVDSRVNPPTDPEWAAGLKPGWQKARIDNFEKGALSGFGPRDADQICDIWTEINHTLSRELTSEGWPHISPETIQARREAIDHRVMQRLRDRVAAIVRDPATAEALKPWYRFMCKRPASNDDYYPTFNRANVTLVDVSGTRGLARLTAKGFIADGREIPVDCIIFASGFEVTSDLPRRWGIGAIDGAAGVSLFDHWAEGYRTFQGVMTQKFPNLFFTGFLQSGFGATTTEALGRHCEHIAHIIAAAKAKHATRVEPTEAAQDAWVKHIRETAVDVSDFARDCTPGYYNGEGDTKKRRWFVGEPYGPGWKAYLEVIEQWRNNGELEGLHIT